MTTESITDLIKEIAVKHNIVLGRDDPVLIVYTMNERLLQESAKAQQKLLETYQSETEAMAKRWQRDAEETAEKILNAALTASKKIMEEKAEALSKSISTEMNTSILQTNQGQLEKVKRMTIINLFSASITTIGVITILYVMLSL